MTVIMNNVKQTDQTFHTLTAGWATGQQFPPIIKLVPLSAGFFCVWVTKRKWMITKRNDDSKSYMDYNLNIILVALSRK